MAETAKNNGDGEVTPPTPIAKGKRYRATKEEMKKRENAAVRLLTQGPLTINALSTASQLPYAKAQALVQKLVGEGRASAIGQEAGRTVYKLDTKVTPKPVRQLPERSFTDFLNQFHIGQELKVVGITLTESGATVDVKAAKDIVKMTLAN